MARVAVHVTPKAGKDEVVGWRGAELLVRVTVPPEGGKANAAVCRTIAALLGVAKSSVSVVRGDISRHKIVEIDGVGEERVEQILGRPEDSLF